MNLEFTPEEQAFRDEVRAFIAENYPKHLGDVGLREDLSREDFLAWHKILGEKGWGRAVRPAMPAPAPRNVDTQLATLCGASPAPAR